MRSNNFNRFFDLPAIPSRVPDINQCRSGSNNFVVRILQSIVRGLVGLAVPNIGGARERVEEFIDQRLEGFFRSRIDQSDIANGPTDKLMKYPLHYLNDIIADLGIFSGCAAREFIDRLLVQKTNQANVTFRQHYELFRIKLVLAGANLERGTSEYFSKDTTPNMPVADAVRISMGLPFIFKPYRITTRAASQMGNPALAGLWVDGGVRNNLPVRAFENEPGTRPHTLGIRLGEETVTPINNIIDLLTALTIRQGLLGSGEAEISRTSGYWQQTVILPTRVAGAAYPFRKRRNSPAGFVNNNTHKSRKLHQINGGRIKHNRYIIPELVEAGSKLAIVGEPLTFPVLPPGQVLVKPGNKMSALVLSKIVINVGGRGELYRDNTI